MNTTAPLHSITLVRIYAASPDALYRAFTDPARMRAWMGGVIEADVRVGGAYRIEIETKDGDPFVHQGRYLDLQPGRRVLQTFKAGPKGTDLDVAGPYRNETIEVQLRPIAAERTELTFIDGWEGDSMPEADREAARAAWSQWLDAVEALLAGHRP